MRFLLIIQMLLISAAAFTQVEDIYKLTFSDTANFKITTFFGNKRPKRILIIDTSQKWMGSRFWVKELDTISTAGRKKLEMDEHHPYNHTYLFKDTTLATLIDVSERKLLSEVATKLKPKRIQLRGLNYLTIPSSKFLKGFYVVTTEPVFSSDSNYAFIDVSVFNKRKRKEDMNDSYFGRTCVIYERINGAWKKLKVRANIAL